MTSGSILINGVNINRINRSSLYKSISSVFQDYHLYPFIIAENVAMNDTYDRELIQQSLSTTLVDKKLTQDNITINDHVLKHFTNKSVDFSGGESQRICISRALYKQGKLVILDEPNSSLDPKTEEVVIKSIFDYSIDSILVMISHKILTTKLSDKVIVLDNGRIVGIGVHQHLVEQNGIYRNLYMNTKKMYKVGDENA